MGNDREKSKWDDDFDNRMNRTQDRLEAEMRARRQGNTLRPPTRSASRQQPRETTGNTSTRRQTTQQDIPSTSGVTPSTSRMRTRLTPSPSPARPSTSRDSAPSSAKKRNPPPVRPSTSRQLQPPSKTKIVTPSKRKSKGVSGSVFTTAERPQASNNSLSGNMAPLASQQSETLHREQFPAIVIPGLSPGSPILDPSKTCKEWKRQRNARANSRNKRKTSQETAGGLNSSNIHLAKKQKTIAEPVGSMHEEFFDIKQERGPNKNHSNSGVEISLENSGGVYESTRLQQQPRLQSDSSDEGGFDYSLFYIDKNSPFDTFEESRIPTGDTAEFPPVEQIQLPKKGRDSSISLKRLSNWQRFCIEKGKEHIDNEDITPQTWGWASSDPNPLFENELKFDEDRSRKCENFLSALKQVDFDCNMDKLPRSRHRKGIIPCEPLAKLRDSDSEGEPITNHQPVKDVTVADARRGKSMSPKHVEEYDALFKEANTLEKTAVVSKGTILDYDWETEKDDGAEEVQRRDPFMNPYFHESLRYTIHYGSRRARQREAVTSNMGNEKKKRPSANELASEDVKLLVDIENLKAKMERDHQKARTHETQLEKEAEFWRSKKSTQQALKYNAWGFTEDSLSPGENSSEKPSIYDPPDYETFPFEGRHHESSYFMNNSGTPQLDNQLYRLSLHSDEPRFFIDGDDRVLIYNSGEDGYFEGISFKEGDSWVGLANKHRDMVASLFHEIENAIKQLDEELESGQKFYYRKMNSSKIFKKAAIDTQAPRHHTGIKYITTLIRIASDLALAKLEVRLEMTSNQSFKSFFKSLFLHGRPQNFGPFVNKNDLLDFIKATLAFLTVLLGNPNVCMCDPGDPLYDDVYEKLGGQFYANIHAWVICLVTYGFRHDDKEYLDTVKPLLINFVRVYEHCQYERYRARKDYNIQFYADVVESNLHNDKPKSEVLQDIMKNYSWKYPIDSLLVTETHRTHGLLHVIEHLTNLGSLPISRFTFLEWTDRVRPRELYDKMSFSEQHAHLMLTQGYRYDYHRFFPMAENHIDNTSIQQLFEFYKLSLQKLNEALPENWKALAKKGSDKLELEDIVAMEAFVDVLEKYIDIFAHGMRPSLGIAHPFKKQFEPFTPVEEIDAQWKRKLANFRRGASDDFWQARVLFTHHFSLATEVVEPFLFCLPPSLRSSWQLLRDVVLPEFTSFIDGTKSSIADPMEEATREREIADNYTRAARGEISLIHGEIFNE